MAFLVYYSLFTILYSLFTKKCEEIVVSYSSPLLVKSLRFASRIVKLYQYLSQEKHESIISKKIIRSGTSTGANANEAVYGVSQADLSLNYRSH